MDAIKTQDYPVDDAIALAESRTGLTLRSAIVATGETPNWETLRDALIWHLETLLEHRIQQLPQLLYRVDVPEAAVDHLFATAKVDDLAPGLADLILMRLLEKLETRRRYEGLL